MNNTPLIPKVNSSSSFEEKKSAVKEILKYGDVPIVYSPSKYMLKPPEEPGLSNLIENAMTEKEVNNLLTKGQLDYKKASCKNNKKVEKNCCKKNCRTHKVKYTHKFIRNVAEKSATFFLFISAR